ncbi:MAG: hypothetical protein HN737_11590 [Desulfobacterales bacterium]|jgi:REP element-mobilizing transposase RayT|nr:hypothetical protein [Desulfobacteraceae bacterium]MBT7085079.1 hypothetical protein [Desulfobacterales bacterium]MBT7698037.1 hypothetical protein [Desulfobacterales bacterium]
MARAKRHFILGYVWHITHRCHKRDFLLKLVKDRQRWIDWLFQTKKRYGLSVLNYIITSNHIHLLVFDNGEKNVIPNSIRYSIIDFAILMKFLQFDNYEVLKESHHKWVEEELKNRNLVRDNKWKESIGVGNNYFLKTVKKKLGYLARGRSILGAGNPDSFLLRESQAKYGVPSIKDIINKIIWDI